MSQCTISHSANVIAPLVGCAICSSFFIKALSMCSYQCNTGQWHIGEWRGGGGGNKGPEADVTLVVAPNFAHIGVARRGTGLLKRHPCQSPLPGMVRSLTLCDGRCQHVNTSGDHVSSLPWPLLPGTGRVACHGPFRAASPDLSLT